MKQVNDNSVNSYDLTQARQFLGSLIGRKDSAAQRSSALVTAPCYSRLATADRSTSAPSAPETSVAAPEVALQELASWEDCLAWCMNITKTESAFVVDSQGFIIACRGEIPAAGFEGAGAEMICSLDELRRIAPDAGEVSFIDIDFEKRRIVGFVASSEPAGLYAVVLIDPEPLPRERKRQIVRQLLHSLPELD